ncbi:BTB domain containing protein [Pandoravirus celtis]|uniref:BTB domain containing protein n=1 Tax=Pandoravirus celtis TaxID=2568002 RepID=A0A4D6EGE6_9VIRU|nr:BTB domain containing protein [Pandoravirus celtis]
MDGGVNGTVDAGEVTPHADVITLDVGGTRVTAHRSTLTMTYPDSLLARAFAPDGDPRWRLPRRPDGASFLDLNPVHFLGVLDVLRHGTTALSTLEPHVERGVALVADYLNMPALAAACTADLGRREIAAAKPARAKTVAVAVIGSDGTLPVVGFDMCDWSACRQVHVLDSWSLSGCVTWSPPTWASTAAHGGARMWKAYYRIHPPHAHVTLDDCDMPFRQIKWRGSNTKAVAGDARWIVRDMRHVPEGEATTAVAPSGTHVPFEPRAECIGAVFKRTTVPLARSANALLWGWNLTRPSSRFCQRPYRVWAWPATLNPCACTASTDLKSSDSTAKRPLRAPTFQSFGLPTAMRATCHQPLPSPSLLTFRRRHDHCCSRRAGAQYRQGHRAHRQHPLFCFSFWMEKIKMRFYVFRNGPQKRQEQQKKSSGSCGRHRRRQRVGRRPRRGWCGWRCGSPRDGRQPGRCRATAREGQAASRSTLAHRGGRARPRSQQKGRRQTDRERVDPPKGEFVALPSIKQDAGVAAQGQDERVGLADHGPEDERLAGVID